MGLFSRLFGTKNESAAPIQPADEVLERLKKGLRVEWDQVLEGRSENAAFALLWDAMEIADPGARVEVIDRVAEFELTSEQADALLLRAAEDTTRIPWVAISVLEACDVRAQVTRAADRNDGKPIAAASAMIGALVEAALTAGPAGDILDVEDGAKVVRSLGRALARMGATPAEMVVIQLCKRLSTHENLSEEDVARGWDETTTRALISANSSVLLGAPRGRGSADWVERLSHEITVGTGVQALTAWQAATLAAMDVRPALLERIAKRPNDDGTWSLALEVLDDDEVRDALIPIAVEELQQRRLREGELCSPASQIGCQSCGGPDSADDDELMVPKALEARLLPLVVACAGHPGSHADLVCECLAAPSIPVRFNTLAVLQHWPTDTIEASIWEVVEALAEDSVPQVRESVRALLERRQKSA